MDAAKKRKAAAGAVLRKKPRRDKSEFVSVEVGMREFKKRLAATDAGAAAAGPAQVEDITQDVKRTRPRATTRARAAADAATADAAVATKKKAPARASAAKKTTPVKKTAPATAKRATAATKKVVAAPAEKKKKTPVKKATPAVKRTTRVAASKLTLAEVKLQLELEQKERVESRIQSLHRDAKPTAAALAAAVDEEGSEIDEEEDDETVTEEVVPASRTSTIDSGNYKEYKVHDEDDLEAVEDKSCDVVLDNTVFLSMTESNFAARPSTPIAAKTNDSSVSVDLGDTSKPATPANSEILERTTAPSNSEDDEEEEDDEVMVVNRVKRREQVHNTTTSAREFQAIKAISFLPNDLKQVLLRGQLVPSNKTEQVPKKPAPSSSLLSPRLLKYLQRHYNESQMQAIFGCLGEDSRVIIQGPPGTGKTKTILGLLSALLDGAGICTLQRAKGTARIRVGASLQSARTSAVSKTVAETSIRILVCAPSNAAVDELVVRVLSEGLYNGERGESYRPRIVRVGRPESSQELSSLAAAREASESKKNRKKMRKYAREVEEVLLESLVTKHRSTFPTVKQARQAIIKNAQIVFCTLSGAGSVAMCEFAQDFDALIIDEAAQAVEASTLIPFKFRPHRVVLVGDHRQLPATVISKKLVSMGYDRSLQQRLVENKSPVLLLTQQYRMHPEIAEFPSTYFYGGRLVQDGNMSNWTAQDYHRDRAFQPLLFLDVQGTQSQVSGSTSLRNMSEVETVVQLIRRLLKKFPHIEWKKRIGVIAPYKQQIYEVRGAIGKLESEFDRHLGIEVNTVDGFQGREKEIIIYSCVRTSHGGRRKKKRRSHGNEEEDVLDAFWADERRMNVAITRAKSSLWIVGNSNLLEQSRAWRTLIQHTKDHSRYIGDSAASLFAPSSSTRKTSKAPSK
ncbi:helicase sen1 [Phytophthora cinnamomi]|uniref:helicase sen1 n=1 Tax=Phytophthora cinnamomi TaxID=4785 RepID=UPI00355A128C|nr:helicase sen1 [Phytophthora cinnamomi]